MHIYTLPAVWTRSTLGKKKKIEQEGKAKDRVDLMAAASGPYRKTFPNRTFTFHVNASKQIWSEMSDIDVNKIYVSVYMRKLAALINILILDSIF